MQRNSRATTLLLCCNLFAQSDTTKHTAHMVAVDGAVRLEVLDWGGRGRSLVLLAGGGDTAHVFDSFAPKLIGDYHVYGVTRRGFGVSSRPTAGYSPDRLGDDVLAVIDALRLNRPVLVGHSIAGQELSSIGSRHPEKVANLIYLDAARAYAYNDGTNDNFNVDLIDARRKLEEIRTLEDKKPGGSRDPRVIVRELLDTDLPRVQRELKDLQGELAAMTDKDISDLAWAPQGPMRAIMAAESKFTLIRSPILAIYAYPPESKTAADELFRARAVALTDVLSGALERGIPSARIVRLRDADHYVFRSNEADVLREMKAFIGPLPSQTRPQSTVK